jgi:hypothetical protein
MGSPYALVGGNNYYFRRGRTYPFTKPLYLASATSSPIVITAYGLGDKPQITAYRALDSSECTEVAFDAWPGSIEVSASSSTNLWRVPRQFLGLYEGDVWGVLTDSADSAGYGAQIPTAAREWCAATDGGTNYKVIYSVGNPVTTYGAVYASPWSDADYDATSKSACIATVRALGGVEISDLSFYRAYCGIRFMASGISFQDMYARSNKALRCEFASTRYGVILAGDNNQTSLRGFSDARVSKNYGENLGQSFVECTSGCLLNSTIVDQNVGNGFGKMQSTGGLYFGKVYTTDGGRVLVERNTMSGGEMGHFWIYDGYAFYAENSSTNLEFKNNFSWNNDKHFISNVSGDDVIFKGNVAISKPGVADGEDRMFVGSGPTASTDVKYINNVAVGCRRFFTATAGGVTGIYRFHGNISYCTDSSGGQNTATNTNALRCGGHDETHIIIDGNNFYGHDALLYDYSVTTNYTSSPQVLNSITSDPATEIARIPTPTDPTVNYALQISPNNWSGTVNLRPGTRLVV